MLIVRLSKIAMTAGLAFWAFLVTLNNLVDYDSNWAFVQHVLVMDTTFPHTTLRSRAVTDAWLHEAAYLTIIVVEGLTCLAFLGASLAMLRKLRAPKAEFQAAKAVTAWGILLAFGLWFVGFMAIGAEWFAMWQSDVWNGQSAAFRFVIIIVAVGIYVFLDSDGDRSP
ncbi:MAG TPA: DUF2165 domain-containing protein [Kiloniellaceae bacterium]|nr:DUF2165 domain-containing protein [Kiloniellaceae bacterium]